MILHIVNAKYIQDYKVQVSFNDGKQGTADLSDLLHGPVFDPLKDKKLFSQLRVDKTLATIAWPNGADLAPESVYFRAFKNVPELQKKFQEWGYK
ncbi:MAG: DUF2442 domain-containing protein [Candidatus Omnitrophica bacterium]|nr:DUF2442 domain-containing protein [Candidatus Omnitrophota bacterium]